VKKKAAHLFVLCVKAKSETRISITKVENSLKISILKSMAVKVLNGNRDRILSG